jgi:LacI family transcriptional regulator
MNRGKLLIVLPYKIGDGFMFKIIMGCVEEANVLGFQYKIIGENNPKERLAILKQEDLSQYTAVITCCYTDEYEYQILDLLKSANLLIMLVDNPIIKGDLPCITCNDYKGGYMMGEHLAKRGHSKIINIANIHRPVTTIERRNKGFLDALRNNNVDYDTSLIVNGYIKEFLERFSPSDFKSGKYTALCSHTSLAIIEIAQFIHDNNIRIGEDVSVIGYGDHPYISGVGIPVSSIEQPSMDMGKTAVDEISAALIERRQLKSIELDVWLVNRHTVKRI